MSNSVSNTPFTPGQEITNFTSLVFDHSDQNAATKPNSDHFIKQLSASSFKTEVPAHSVNRLWGSSKSHLP